MISALRELLQTYLLTKADSVYFEEATEGAEFPYIVYSFNPSFVNSEASEGMLIDIEGWDSPTDGDSSTLEALMESINGTGDVEQDPTGLDNEILSNDDILVNFNLDSRTVIRDDTPGLIRRKYSYAATIYTKKEA